MISDLKEYSNKQMNEIRKIIQDMEKKMNGKISKENITNRLDRAEERISGIEDKVKKIYYNSNKAGRGCMTTVFKKFET
jgi:uncharacterized protein Yka (UPF0111/DUF47 family)